MCACPDAAVSALSSHCHSLAPRQTRAADKKAKDAEPAEDGLSSRFARKGDPPAAAKKDDDDDDDDDGPRDFGGRVTKPGPAQAAAQDDEEVFIDDDGPGDFGGRVTQPAAPAPAITIASSHDDHHHGDDDDDDGPGDFGGRVNRTAPKAKGSAEEQRPETPDAVVDTGSVRAARAASLSLVSMADIGSFLSPRLTIPGGTTANPEAGTGAFARGGGGGGGWHAWV
jgi:hypothetical protein